MGRVNWNLIVLFLALIPVGYASAVTNYTYDANGNMLSDGRFYYVYDALNHMTEVREVGPSGALVEKYWYDHAGRRVIKEEYTSNGTITTYYVNEFFEMTVNPDGTTVNTSYIYANGERVAKEVTSVNGTEVYYYHSDHLGSTSVVTRKGRLFAGTISTNHNWTLVLLNESLVRPVVIARLMTENDEDNSVGRINNVTASSFQLRVEESPSYDGNHINESLGYIALEEGTITDGGADIGQAGVAEAGDVWTRVGFANKFNVVPVIVASPMSVQNGGQGAVRIRNIDITGFDARFEEYPSLDGGHKLEKIGWVAMKPGTWTLDSKIIIASTASSVTANYSSVTFPQNFTTAPIVVLAQTQSYNEGDLASHPRQRNPSASGFEVKIEEEIDTTHNAETVGYVAVEPSILKSGAAKVEETEYYPYGVVQEGGGEKYLYTGKERDKGTGLYYYGARYYNPSVGRFTQPDPMISNQFNPQSLNRHSYVLNNPLVYNDPTGKEPNKAQAGSISQLPLEAFVSIQAARTFFDADVNHNNPNVVRYVYTESHGWVDMYHFFRGADHGQSSEKGTLVFGYLLEVGQAIVGIPGALGLGDNTWWGEKSQMQWHSAFSYEDAGSNLAGVGFGKFLEENAGSGKTFGELLLEYFDNIGAQEKDEDADWYKSLPEKDDPNVAPQSRILNPLSYLVSKYSGGSNSNKDGSSRGRGGHGGTWSGNIYTDRYGRTYEQDKSGAMRQKK